MNKYDFNLNSGMLKQEETITSIIEGRMVPRDLINETTIKEASNLTKDSYLYIDNNGEPEKISMQDLNAAVLPVVSKEPTKPIVGQIIFKEIN